MAESVGGPLWEGQLELVESEVERGVEEERSLDLARDMPLLRIEPAKAWMLSDVIEPSEQWEQALSGQDHEYVVVRFDCSFRPKVDRVQIEWARFRVKLAPDPSGALGLVEDLHPLRIDKEIRRQVGLKIAPTLKFQEVGVGLGEITSGHDYDAIEPVIEAAGRGGHDVNWDYSTPPGVSIGGSKRMHAIVRVPAGVDALDAVLYLSADVRVDRRFLWTASRQQDEEPLQVRLWERASGAPA
ncbi:MAG TPA: hypothetical protein VLK89_02710 [Solirubrobacterales bacterium]|nr:hypothetical protein [Solirubrobacterales bacterium]